MRYMSIHQNYFGRKFYKDKKTGYWISTDYPRIRAHCWVWKNFHTLIPKGYHIHHMNGDKSDNSIENLELIKRERHMSYHMQDPERKRKARENCNRIRPLTKAWHASEEGIAWHKYHAAKERFGKWDPRKYYCQQCNKTYETKKRSNSRFCSNACKSKWRRHAGLDDIEKGCERCLNIFVSNKYIKQRFCSRTCVSAKSKN